MTINLYFVRWDNEDGENQDLLVEAEDEDQALNLWRSHFEIEPEQDPDWSGIVHLTGKPGAIDWADINYG